MTTDFFRARLDQMIDLKHSLAALAQRFPWDQIEAALRRHPDRTHPRHNRRSLRGKTAQATIDIAVVTQVVQLLLRPGFVARLVRFLAVPSPASDYLPPFAIVLAGLCGVR